MFQRTPSLFAGYEDQTLASISIEEGFSNRSYANKEIDPIKYMKKCPMNLPDEEDEQVLMSEIHAEMCHETGGDNEAVDNEDQHVEVQRAIDEQVLASQKKLDKGKGLFNADRGNLKRKNINSRSKGNGIVIRENDDSSYGNDCDCDSDSETDQEKGFYRFDESDSEVSLKSYDYLSDGEDEVIQLRKRMYEFKSGGAEAQEQGEPNQNEQNPPSQDEGFATPLRMFDMGISDTVKEHEQDMDILIRRIKAKGNNLKDPFQLLGEKFVTVGQFKECLPYYALANGFSLWNERTDEVSAKCGQRTEVIKDPSKGKQRAYKNFPTKDPNEASSHFICPWRCYAKKLKVDGSFQENTLEIRLGANPKSTLHALADLVMKKYGCIVSLNQCRRAKEYALSEGECSLQDHYGMLWSYTKAILDSNKGSTVKVSVNVNPDEKIYFDRFYVCLHGLKEGWKLGCRKIIALDGCFLKKPNSREILTAVGRDGNNQIYPVAWAIVNVKNKKNCTTTKKKTASTSSTTKGKKPKDLKFQTKLQIILIRDEQRHRKNDDDDILNDDDVARVQILKKELASKTEIKCHRSKLGDGTDLHFFVIAVTEPSMGQTGFILSLTDFGLPNNPLSGIFEVD
uniref:Pentatricopeptide repeat-containing protein n=1 Tax=Tanacetum cinerariifolium TaxID=118510 RepID=A0A6L2KNA5_TANCI|nr:pentatricopeptide repeat-containing protein [Tanacetum cinerariifolium]